MFLRAIGRVFLILLGLAVLLVLYGVLIEPRFMIVTEKLEASIPNLPAEWEGQEIAVISDLQVGMWLDNTGAVEEAVEDILEDPPAAALVIGDYIYHSPDDPEEVIETAQELLAPLGEAGIPVYGTLGNHDYHVANYEDPSINYERAEKVAEALEAVGIQMVDNEAIALEPSGGAQGEPFYLVGIGSYMANNSHPEQAFSQIADDAPRFTFMHHPNSFADIAAGQAPVAVAGHTHGGQIRIPGLPEWSYLTYLQDDQVHADGWIDGYGQPGNRLYVTRGIGFSILPIRINCPPEISRFRLTAAPEDPQ